MACCDSCDHGHACDNTRTREGRPFGNTNLQGIFTTRSREAFPFANLALSGHPHTVRAPQTPLYQLGWLGDSVDFTDLGPPVDSPILGPIDYSASFPASPDQVSVDTPVNPISPVVFGPPGPGQPGGVPAAAGVATSLTQSIANFFKPTTPVLQPGVAPRVSGCPAGYGINAAGQCVPTSGTISLGSALPILGIGAVVLIAISTIGGGKRRRR